MKFIDDFKINQFIMESTLKKWMQNSKNNKILVSPNLTCVITYGAIKIYCKAIYTNQ